MLHAGEKWAAVEYSTSPPQEEEEVGVEGWRDGGREGGGVYVCGEGGGGFKRSISKSKSGEDYNYN